VEFEVSLQVAAGAAEVGDEVGHGAVSFIGVGEVGEFGAGVGAVQEEVLEQGQGSGEVLGVVGVVFAYGCGSNAVRSRC
jgi:hypothetical protein